MEKINNIDFFNALTLTVFDRLYSAFPVPVELDVGKLATEILPSECGFEHAFDALIAAGQAIDFLAQEGFMTHKGALLSGGTYVQARLTLKGLAILGAPDALEGNKQLIASVKSAVGAVAKEGASEAARQVVQKVFALSLSSVSSIAGLMSGG